MMPITNVVKQLLILNIIFYLGSNFVGEFAYDLLALFYPESPNFRFWQPLTHMFMHAKFPSITHIVFNMLGLAMFGSPLEHYWGSKRFIFFYISCGLGAALVQILATYLQINSVVESLSYLNLSSTEMHAMLSADYGLVFDASNQMVDGPIKNIVDKHNIQQADFNIMLTAVQNFQTPMVGASGAIYGLLIAFAFMFPNAELMLLFIPFPVKAKFFVPVLVALDLFSGVTGFSIFGSGVAHFAHVGGALVGFIMMMIWRKNKFKQNRWN